MSSRLDGADAAAKNAEERLQPVIDELNVEVEQVCYSLNTSSSSRMWPQTPCSCIATSISSESCR